ncbi:hypothetical protein [Burkholderia gladioli]|uniref:hypothetical protein n=1 Tax=Burkholderia gladioli TaxID=28095 RepID=UPI00163FEC5C|nr:hypothetical protein [Burkholderia gladioli]
MRILLILAACASLAGCPAPVKPPAPAAIPTTRLVDTSCSAPLVTFGPADEPLTKRQIIAYQLWRQAHHCVP